MRTENPCFKRKTGVNSDPVPLDNLRLEISADCFYLLPYHHVELVKFESAQDEDTIMISFLNRTVRLTGKNLRDLGIALQGRCVEFVKPVPERYTALASGDAAITVIEIENKSEQGQ